MHGPLQVICDSPEYPVVRACAQIGLINPEDVRWCHRRRAKARGDQCSCGRPWPRLSKYTFTLSNGHKRVFLLAQCLGCRTIYWEEELNSGKQK